MNLASEIVLAIGAVICHQRPERSFFWDGHQFPVCARCTGLYFSAALGLVGWLVIKMRGEWRPRPIDPRTARTFVIVAALPTAISLGTGALGVWDGSNITRAMLSLPIGAVAGVVVAAVATKDLR